jgi:hypothetical protein
MIADWLGLVTDEASIDAMASLGEYHVRQTLADGTRISLKMVAPNLDPDFTPSGRQKRKLPPSPNEPESVFGPRRLPLARCRHCGRTMENDPVTGHSCPV